MAEQPKALMTVVGRDRPPSLADAAQQLGVETADIDASYGVVPVDPDNGLYAVMTRADRLGQPSQDEYRGPFSDPKIEPFDV